MRLSFRLREKLMVITTIIVLSSISVTIYFNLRHFIRVYKESVSRRVFACSIGLRDAVETIIELGLRKPLGELVGLNAECQKIVKTIPYAKFCFIMSPTGRVYYHNLPEEVDKVYVDSITQNAIRARGETVQFYRTKLGEKIYDFSEPIVDLDGERIGLIRIGVLSTIIDKEVFDMITRASWLGILFVIITCIAIFFLSNFSILIPIRKLMAGVSKIGKGELDSKIELKTKDEFSQLAEAFNKMASDLKGSMVSIEVLRVLQERFQDVAESTNDWIWEIDTQGRYTYSSLGAEKILGYKLEEILGKYFYDFFHPDEREELKKAAFETFSKKEEFKSFLNRNIKKDGQVVIIETNGVPILSKEGELLGYRGADRDITERKKAEEALKSAYDQLRTTQARMIQTAKMAAVGQLSAGVAHEINNPLGGILGYAQFILSKLGGPEFTVDDFKTCRKYLEQIERESQRCKQIVESLLTFSRKSSEKFESVDVKSTMETILSILRRSLELQNIKVTIEYAPQLLQVFGNVNKLQQVFTNIIINTQQAMPEGGELIISAKVVEKDKKKKVAISFQDTGCGIPKENLGEIFEPFFTTKQEMKSLGLGLAICYEIIQEHNGEILVESEVGKGTKFTIILPCNDKP